MVDFGDKLRALRLAENLTQKEAARKVGVSNSMISSYENGLRQPSFEVLIKLASIYKVSTDYILGCEHNENSYSLDGLTSEQTETILKIIQNMKTANKLS